MKTILVLVLVFAFIELSACVERKALLKCGEYLGVNEYLESSNGYYLVMQGDCNLVIYSSKHFVTRNALWSSGTVNTFCSNPRLVNQRNGNLVIYTGSTALWSTRTNSRSKCYQLIIQDDGNLVLYTSDYTALWNSATFA